MATIRLNLKRNKGRRSTVLAIVRHEGRRHVLGTGVSVLVGDWDRKRERCVVDAEANKRLAEFVGTVRRLVETTGRVPERIDLGQGGGGERQTILGAIEERRERLVAGGGAANSWKAYQTLAALVKRYVEAEGRRERLVSEVSSAWVSGLIAWMIRQDYKNGHTAKMLRVLRASLRDKVAASVWKGVAAPKNVPTEMVYLSPEEIGLLEAMQFEPGDKLERVRDLFLVGCYTALRQSDWRKVDWTRAQVVAGVKVLIIVQQKTGGHTALPIGERLAALMDKYRMEGWPKLSVQKFNKSVKELCRKAGIVQQVSITECRGGKTVVLTGQKWEFVSSHTARRSFATNAVLAGIPVSEVMKFTGHKSLTAFFQYIRTTGQEAAVAYSQHPFFAGK